MTTARELQAAIFSPEQRALLLTAWIRYQHAGGYPGRKENVVPDYDESEWLDYKERDAMELVAQTTSLIQQLNHTTWRPSCWAHRLAKTQYWLDLEKQDDIHVAALPAVQAVIDKFNAEIENLKAKNPRVPCVSVLYGSNIDMTPLRTKMAKYIAYGNKHRQYPDIHPSICHVGIKPKKENVV